MNVVFLHGAGCLPPVFDEQLRAFPGSRVCLLPGHGAPGACASISAFADAVARDLDARGERIVLCGNSMGGAIALELAVRAHPAVAAVVAIGSGARLRVAPAFFGEIERDFEAAAQQLAALFYANATPERVAYSAAQMRAVGRDVTLADYRACDAFDITDRLAEIGIPAAFFTGEGDRMTPPKYATFLGDRVAGAEVRILPDAGHLAMLEQPPVTNEALRSFVTRISQT